MALKIIADKRAGEEAFSCRKCGMFMIRWNRPALPAGRFLPETHL